MFAFAIYDRKRRELFLARDRFGVKPLFYAQLSDGSVAFASELKGLLAHPLMRREVDPRAIEDFMAWGYVPDHRSILQGVQKLPAGHTLLLNHDSPVPKPSQYWDISFAERHKGKAKDLEAELLHHLQQAVTSRMVADVPLGAFLSGGVDSSSVVALMAEASRQPVKTCSIGFDVAAPTKPAMPKPWPRLFATDHEARTVSADQFDAIDTIAGMFDEPFADASALPTWRVCQLAHENVTVALSGDGADEALAGYRRQVFHAHEERLRAHAARSAAQAMYWARWARSIPRPTGHRVRCAPRRRCCRSPDRARGDMRARCRFSRQRAASRSIRRSLRASWAVTGPKIPCST